MKKKYATPLEGGVGAKTIHPMGKNTSREETGRKQRAKTNLPPEREGGGEGAKQCSRRTYAHKGGRGAELPHTIHTHPPPQGGRAKNHARALGGGGVKIQYPRAPQPPTR